MIRATLMAVALGSAVALAPAPACTQAAADGDGGSFWQPHYLVDYGLVLGGLYIRVIADLTPTTRARIGPSFDPDDPARILAPEYTRRLGGAYTPERDWTLPDGLMAAAAASHLVLIPAHEILASRATGRPVSAHRVHHATLAAAEALMVGTAVSTLAKTWVGRLRPDFQDRVRHVYCSLPDPAGVDCSGVDPARLFDDPDRALKELESGRASFPSGHAMTGMVIATNLALHVGGHWVWGQEATPTSRRAGIAAMAVIGGLGAFPGISRTSLMDDVHHTSDVVAGGILGMAMGGLFYWLHFDGSGEPRPGHWLARNPARPTSGPMPAHLRLVSDGTAVGLQATWHTR
jgi:membrane-associated phospholipid phosphatase